MLASKLTTIFCCDLVGFSSMMDQDEHGTIARLNECIDVIILPMIDEYAGRKFSGAGDSVYAEFPSAVNAVNFAINCQQALHTRNRKNPSQPPMLFRFSVHLGEAVVNGTDLLGETVNIAARIEPLAEYGGILISETVYQQVIRKLSTVKFVDQGLKQLKGISAPVKVYAIPVIGSKPNPYANTVIAATTVPSATASVVSLRSLLSDRSMEGQTLSMAQDLKRRGDFNKAIAVFSVLSAKRDTVAVDELINLVEKKLVPVALLLVVGEALESGAKFAVDEKQHKIGSMFKSGALGEDQRTKCIKIWALCADSHADTQYELGCAMLDSPGCSRADQILAVGYLEKAARARFILAAMRLGRYYSDKNTDGYDAFKAFDWYWVARAYKNPNAQSALETLSRSMSRADIQNARISGDALVDDINWSSQH